MHMFSNAFQKLEGYKAITIISILLFAIFFPFQHEGSFYVDAPADGNEHSYDISFIGPLKSLPPNLNDTSLRTFVSNGAAVGGIPINRGNELPAALIVTSEKQISSPPQAVTFTTPAAVSSSTSQIFSAFNIPTYSAPSRNIASKIIYVPPSFVIKQLNSNNNFILTPKIDRIFPNMTMLINQNSATQSGLAKVEQIRMKFAQEGTAIGFSFGISDTIPDVFRLPKTPIDTLALFMTIGYIGGAGEVKVVNFSNPKSFISSPEITIYVNRSINITKLADGCPDIRLFSFNESTANWQQQVDKPIHAAMLDVHNECAYILRTEHFSKFAVGGVKPPPTELAQ
jgi:hypothetical protein